MFEVAVVGAEGCKWTETSHAAAKWQFWEADDGWGRGRRGDGIRRSEKGREDRKGRGPRREKREARHRVLRAGCVAGINDKNGQEERPVRG